MNPVREAIVDALSGDATLNGILSDDDAIFHRIAPQGTHYPYIVLFKQAGTPEYTFGDHHNEEVWTIKAVTKGDDASDAEDLTERIEQLLHDAPLSISGFATLYCRRESDLDFAEMDKGAAIHHVGAMYRIYTQPNP